MSSDNYIMVRKWKDGRYIMVRKWKDGRYFLSTVFASDERWDTDAEVIAWFEKDGRTPSEMYDSLDEAWQQACREYSEYGAIVSSSINYRMEEV